MRQNFLLRGTYRLMFLPRISVVTAVTVPAALMSVRICASKVLFAVYLSLVLVVVVVRLAPSSTTTITVPTVTAV